MKSFLIGTDEKQNLLLIEKDTGKKYTFYTAEAAVSFLKAHKKDTTIHKSS